MNKKILGYFMQGEIYYHGKMQPNRKTAIYQIDSGAIPLEKRKPNDNIHVMDENGNWFTIKVFQLIK